MDEIKDKIAVVHQNDEARSALSKLLKMLGYDALEAPTGADLLKMIMDPRGINVAIVNIHLSDFDGVSLIKEIRHRHRSNKELSILVTAADPDTAEVVECLKAGADDYIHYPPSLSKISQTLNEAGINRRRFTLNNDRLKFSFDSEIRSGTISDRLTKNNLDLRSVIKWRRSREEYFKSLRFTDPYWDILLELTNAFQQGVESPLLSVYAASNVPMSTAARYVQALHEKGLVTRWEDSMDRRRICVSLTEETFEQMRECMGQINIDL